MALKILCDGYVMKNEPEKRKCRLCGELKILSLFPKKNTLRGGFDRGCSACLAKQNKMLKTKNKYPRDEDDFPVNTYVDQPGFLRLKGAIVLILKRQGEACTMRTLKAGLTARYAYNGRMDYKLNHALKELESEGEISVNRKVIDLTMYSLGDGKPEKKTKGAYKFQLSSRPRVITPYFEQ
ncbi:MAG: hypothetical protein M3367_03265 [Acidobacteriota bacterium]|nr:hypothetical protein [Acidobacteriota bacterium]